MSSNFKKKQDALERRLADKKFALAKALIVLAHTDTPSFEKNVADFYRVLDEHILTIMQPGDDDRGDI